MRNEKIRPLPEVLIVGPPESRRVQAFAETARRLGAPVVRIKSYSELIQGEHNLPRPGTLVRLESPGGCSMTTRALLKAGIEPLTIAGGVPISAEQVDGLACDRGEVLYPRQWFLGFRHVLNSLSSAWKNEEIHWMSSPESIITAFDKIECLNLWARSDLPIPRQFVGATTYSQIRGLVPDRHARIFIKLRYGYSAMGAVALEWRDNLVRAITTVESTWCNGRPRLFVTKRPQQLRREFEIAWLIDTLGMEQIVVEEWLPKARWNGKPYDLRVVMIAGRVCHVVGRSSSSPFTNLNLDARRIACEDVRQQLGDAWWNLQALCEHAATDFPGAGMLGLDVLVHPCRKKFSLLEANAFGDYLPGLLHLGQTTYEMQLRANQHALTELCG